MGAEPCLYHELFGMQEWKLWNWSTEEFPQQNFILLILPSNHPFSHPSTHQPIHPFSHPSTHQPIHPSVLSFHPSTFDHFRWYCTLQIFKYSSKVNRIDNTVQSLMAVNRSLYNSFSSLVADGTWLYFFDELGELNTREGNRRLAALKVGHVPTLGVG